MNTASQITEVLDSLQTTLGFGGKGRQRRGQQVTERLLVSTSYPSAHLMQIAQSEILRLIDDDGVGIRNIDTALDDGRCQQDIVIIVHKIEDDLFQFLRLHLSVSDTNPAIRDIPLYHRLQFRQILDAVVHEEHLSVTAHLKIDGLGNDLLVERMYFRLDRITVGWRSLDNRQITRSHQRELQGTRNRCSRHGQGIDIHLQLTELFLHTHSEFLFLIDNQQSQILELDTLADNLMRTDQDVQISFGQVFQNLMGIFGRTGTAQVVHLARHSFQTLLERLVMLESQYRGRYQYRHLLVVGHRLERGTYRHLCLTEAHIAAHQTVHRPVTLHIGFHLLGSLQLVGGIFVKEARLQFMLQEAVRTVAETLFLFTLRIKPNQIAGNVLDFRFGTFLDFLPGSGTQLADAGRFTFLPLVFRNLMQGMNGNEHYIVILIDQFDDFLCSISVRNPHQTGKTSDTVVDMDHIIARLEHIQLLQRKSHLSAAGFVAAKVVFMETVENLMVGKDTAAQGMVNESLVQSMVYRFELDAVSPFLKNILQTVGLLHTVRTNEQTVTPLQIVGQRAGDQIEILMENRLYRSFELQRGLRCTHSLASKINPAEIECPVHERSPVNQPFLQIGNPGFISFVSHLRLW